MKKKIYIGLVFTLIFGIAAPQVSHAFWIWTPKGKTMINPKFAVKDSPSEQFDWAMRFYKQSDFKRAAEEFERLTEYYGDSDLAPEAQYYAGRSYEEIGKYYFAFQNYQKTIDEYPYTKRLEEIVEREYNIANIFQSKDVPKLMELELSESLGRAVEIYKKVVDNSTFGKYADKALYNMGECYRREFKYAEAVEAYKTIVTDYPDSDLVDEAKYQFAYTRYEASLDPEYDQESTEEALKEFQEISQNTSVPALAEEANKVFAELKERKAGSVYRVAEFYEKQKQYKAAIMYYEEVVNKYKGTGSAKVAAAKIELLKIKASD